MAISSLWDKQKTSDMLRYQGEGPQSVILTVYYQPCIFNTQYTTATWFDTPSTLSLVVMVLLYDCYHIHQPHTNYDKMMCPAPPEMSCTK